MRTLLEEFWYGNVNPQEQSTEGNREIIIEREIFAYGFRLGGRFMLETLTGLNFED